MKKKKIIILSIMIIVVALLLEESILKYVNDRNAAQEKTVYYTLDNVNFNESQELIKNKPLEFHLK